MARQCSDSRAGRVPVDQPGVEMAQMLNVPAVVHGVTVLHHAETPRIARFLHADFPIRLEHGFGSPCQGTRSGRDDIGSVLDAVEWLRAVGVANDRIEICVDLGHVARCYRNGRWNGRPETYIGQALLPDLRTYDEEGLRVSEAHVHNLVPGRGLQGDHHHLEESGGVIPIADTVQFLAERYPGISFAIETGAESALVAKLAGLGWVDQIRREEEDRLLEDVELVIEAAS